MDMSLQATAQEAAVESTGDGVMLVPCDDRPTCHCEDLQDYHPGGYHAVVIGDRIHHRYEIIHKLGFGGTATVWLARDHEAARNVALKIHLAHRTALNGGGELAAYKYLQSKLPAEQRHLLVPLYDSFNIEGPNGTHLCLSMGLAGPSLGDIVSRDASMKIRPDVVQQLGLQVVQGLAEIHKTGITYNDFTPNNILLQLDETIATLPAAELYDLLGHPQPEAVLDSDTSEYGTKSHRPTHVYPALNLTDPDKLSLLKPAIKFIDVAEVRYVGEPEPDANHGLTFLYSDPEALYWRQRQVQAADIWSLACILFELRACDSLFPPGSCGHEDVKRGMITCIGPLPEAWQKKILEDSGVEDGDAANDEDLFERPTVWEFDDADFGNLDLGGDYSQADDSAGRKWTSRVHAFASRLKEAVGSIFRGRRPVAPAESEPLQFYIKHDGIPQTKKSLEEAVQSIGVWAPWCRMSVEERMEKLSAVYDLCGGGEATREECDTGEPPHKALSVEEARDFIELLAMMLTWRRDVRAPLEKVLEHRWFTVDYSCDTEAPWLQRYHRGYQYFVDGEQLV